MVLFNSGAVLQASALNSAFNQLTINAQTTSYTLALSDQGGFVSVNSASATAVTIPPNSTVAFATGTVVIVAALGDGLVTLTAGAGVTVNATPGLKLRTKYSAATLIKTGTNTWLAIGDLSA
jgi:hypothetical protein